MPRRHPDCGEKPDLVPFSQHPGLGTAIAQPSAYSSEGALEPQNLTLLIPFLPPRLWRNPSTFLSDPEEAVMKILTNIALATCVGLALGWMSSCASERTVETTTTRAVDTTPAPAVVSVAPVVSEPAVVAPTTTSTTRTVTQYNSAYPHVMPPAPVVVTTTPPAESTTTQTTTTTTEDSR